MLACESNTDIGGSRLYCCDRAWGWQGGRGWGGSGGRNSLPRAETACPASSCARPPVPQTAAPSPYTGSHLPALSGVSVSIAVVIVRFLHLTVPPRFSFRRVGFLGRAPTAHAILSWQEFPSEASQPVQDPLWPCQSPKCACASLCLKGHSLTIISDGVEAVVCLAEGHPGFTAQWGKQKSK